MTLILVGMLFVQLPAIAPVKSPRVRFRLRRDAFKLTAALEDGNSERASWLCRWLRLVVTVVCVLALVIVLLDAAGPAMIPL